MCPHDIPRNLAKIFDLHRVCWENSRQIHIERLLAIKVWILQRCFYQKRQKRWEDHWILKETEEDMTTKGNTWSLAGYWLAGRNI